MNCLRPLMTHSSPFRTARVCIAASGTLYGSQRSDAPRGSVRQCARRNPGSFTMRGNQSSCRWRGATLRSSTETFQSCTSLSERPESPRAISSEMRAKVCTSCAGSSGTPPNSSGTPSVRIPILSACSSMERGRRASGSISHSRCQFWRMNGVTKSSTKARQLSRISRCSSDKLRSMVSIGGGNDDTPERRGVSKPAPQLRVPRNDERFAGLEERLQAGEDLGPAFPHRLEGSAAPGKLIVGDGELAHQSHRLDLVAHARGLVLDELGLEAVHQLLSRNHLDHHAFHARARPPVQFGAMHVVEPSAALELGVELEAHIVF